MMCLSNETQNLTAMKPFFFIFILLFPIRVFCQSDGVEERFHNMLDSLVRKTDDPWVQFSFNSMKEVIAAKGTLTPTDLKLLEATLEVFYDHYSSGNPAKVESYYARQRPLVIAWESPTDHKTSFAKVKLPSGFKPFESYPMYVDLHGLWSVADNPIDFMTYSFRNGASSTFAYDNGFELAMWGRGNQWYREISETDIWEGIEVIENMFNIDQNRKYITGHSMGGYGAWRIASRSSDVWAGVGVHAGALYYGTEDMLSNTVIGQLKDVPVYFVCGNTDGLYQINYEAYMKLSDAGNANVEFVSFNGGHDYHQENVEKMYMWLRTFSKDDYVSVDDFKAESDVRIYPSKVPYNGRLNFELKEGKTVTIEIYNLQGQLKAIQKNKEVNAGKFVCHLEDFNLRPGMYIVTTVTDDICVSQKVLLE